MIDVFQSWKKKSKKIETSKLLLKTIYIAIAILFPVIIYLAIVCNIITPLEELIAGLFSLASIATGFYYWKAKAENLHKYKLDDKIGMKDED